jgi:hypothetical protein
MDASRDNESSVQLLKELQEQVYSSNASIRRRAAYNLAWLQEDGLNVLKGLLFSNVQITTKNAAAYGLRKMQGRMKKLAIDVLMQGLKDHNSSTVVVCINALQLLGQKIPDEFKQRNRITGIRSPRNKLRIMDIPSRSRPRKTIDSR